MISSTLGMRLAVDTSMTTTHTSIKVITTAEWASYTKVQGPTATAGAIRSDADARLWQWLSSGARVTVGMVDVSSVITAR